MAVNVCRGADVAVPQPLLNLLHGHVVCQQQRGTWVPEIVKAENGDYSIITTKNMIKCCGKNLPWHFCFTGRLDNGEKK
jgi:hypothetical protein